MFALHLGNLWIVDILAQGSDSDDSSHDSSTVWLICTIDYHISPSIYTR